MATRRKAGVFQRNGLQSSTGKRVCFATKEGPREGAACTKQVEATKVIKVGARALAQTPTKEEATTPVREDTSPTHLPNEAVETVASRATRFAMIKSKR